MMVLGVYVVLCLFGIMNVIIGVICENTSTAAAEAAATHEALKFEKRRKVMEELIHFIQVSNAGEDDNVNEVTQAEFLRWLDNRDLDAHDLRLPLPLEGKELFTYLDTPGIGKV